jgi:hypothetical protein
VQQSKPQALLVQIGKQVRIRRRWSCDVRRPMKVTVNGQAEMVSIARPPHRRSTASC